MPLPLENFIVQAIPDPESPTVTIKWANGAATAASFRHLLHIGVMKRLADPAFFARVKVGERGRSLVWPGEIEFCADALWFDTHPEDNPYLQSAGVGATT